MYSPTSLVVVDLVSRVRTFVTVTFAPTTTLPDPSVTVPTIAAVRDCVADQANPFEVDGQLVAVFNLGERFFVTSNVCTHQFALMSDGHVDGEYVECPMHQGRFPIPTGCAKGVPVSEALRTYPLRVRDGQIEISLDEEGPP